MKKSNVRFWGLGSASIDFRIRTAEMGVGHTEKLLAQEVNVCPGGSVANCLAQISALGARAGWLGKLGRDWIGQKIIQQLTDSGISTEGVRYDSGACSPFNLAAYAGEARRRVGGWLLPNSLSTIRDDDISHWESLVQPENWLIVEIGEIPLPILHEAVQRLTRNGVRVAVDVDLDPLKQCGASLDEVRALFGLAHLLIPNRNALVSIYGEISAEALTSTMFRDYQVPVVVTAGSEGAWAIESERALLHQPAIPVEVVDTVGAGDAFHGGLVWALGTGHPLKIALKTATQCGARACQVREARPQHSIFA